MMCLNVQGLLYHKNEIEEVIIKKYRPDVFIAVETHVNNEVLDHEIAIQGYTTERCNSTNKRTGGVIAYISSNIRYETVCTECYLNNTWYLILKINSIYHRGYIVGLYHSPNTSNAEFLEILENITEMY